MTDFFLEVPSFVYTAFSLLAIFVLVSKAQSYRAKKAREKLIAKDPSKGVPISKQEIGELEAWLDNQALPYAAITIAETLPTDVGGSRVGGPAAFLPGEQWPIGKNGKPMIFLAQINFAEMPNLADYPEYGLLQIFVADGSSFGASFEGPLQDDKKLVWHEDPEKASAIIDPPNDPKAHTPFTSVDVWMKGRTITFGRGYMRPNWNIWTIEEKLKEFADKPNEDEVLEAIFDEVEHTAQYIGGYPNFTQDDVRSIDRFSSYDRVLFQMGSDDLIMWGDTGEAVFMVKREDLLARKFDDVLYSWDCT